MSTRFGTTSAPHLDLPAELGRMTWRDAQCHPRRLLVVPVGSLEQHGPHLPLDCDSRIAVAVADAVRAQIDDAATAPLIPIGASGEHADFPGTLSIGADALTALVVELSRHAARDWHEMLVVNGHGGNRAALDRASRICALEGRQVRVWHATWQDGDAHAGRTETSLLLHLAPDQVRLALAEPGNCAPLAQLMPALRTGGVRLVSPNGVLGDPRHACATEGKELFTAMVRGAVAMAFGSRIDESPGQAR